MPYRTFFCYANSTQEAEEWIKILQWKLVGGKAMLNNYLWHLGFYSQVFTLPEVNNCFCIIIKGDYQLEKYALFSSKQLSSSLISLDVSHLK